MHVKTAIKLLRGPPHMCLPQKLQEGVGTDEKKLKQRITARQTVDRHNEIFGVTAAFENSSNKVKLN